MKLPKSIFLASSLARISGFLMARQLPRIFVFMTIYAVFSSLAFGIQTFRDEVSDQGRINARGFYQKGVAAYREFFETNDKDRIKQALQFFTESIREDPNFRLASFWQATMARYLDDSHLQQTALVRHYQYSDLD